jgi:HEAT repeat protein
MKRIIWVAAAASVMGATSAAAAEGEAPAGAPVETAAAVWGGPTTGPMASPTLGVGGRAETPAGQSSLDNLTHPDAAVRGEAAASLAGSAEGRRTLLRFVCDHRDADWAAALPHLGLHDSDTRAQVLAAAGARARDARAQRALATALKPQPGAALEVVEAAMQGRLDPATLAALLAEISPTAPRAIAPYLRSPNPQAKTRALGLARATGHQELTPLIVDASRDPSARVRAAAVNALTTMGGSEARLVALEALTDPDPLVRTEAARAVAQLGIDSASSTLVALLVGSGADRVELVRALSALKSPDAMPYLLQVWPAAPPELRLAILELGRTVGGDAATTVLELAAQEGDSLVASRAREYLASR